MQLLDLNEDVLTVAISFLSSQDARGLGRTCHFAYTLTLPHRLADVSISSDQLYAFCIYMLAEDCRPHYLRKLTFCYNAPGMWALPFLAQVLESTDKLEALSIMNAGFALGNQYSPSLRAALKSCRTLKDISFTQTVGVGDITLEVLSTMACPLTHLHISNIMDDRSDDQHRFANMLLPFTKSLTSLDVRYLPYAWPELRALGEVAIWPRMHTLHLRSLHPDRLIGMPQAFPNLQVLHLHWDVTGAWHGSDSDMARWTKLDYVSSQYCPPIAAAVRRIELSPRHAHDDDPLLSHFLPSCAPVVLTCSIRKNLLQLLEQLKPSLRYLALCEDPGNCPSLFFTLSKFVMEILRMNLQLVGLRFHLQSIWRGDGGGPSPFSMVMLTRLAQEAAQQMPSLRFLGFKCSDRSPWFGLTPDANGTTRSVALMSQSKGEEAESMLLALAK